MEESDEETMRMVEGVVVPRVATKHINIWIRQLEIKRIEISELAELFGFECVKEVEKEKSLERWARRCTHHFTKKVKRMLYEEIDNTVLNGDEKEVSQLCERNKVHDEITEAEIGEIWHRADPAEDENIGLNGKNVWETAKRVCDYINSHEDLIHITTFGEYRDVMKKVIKVIQTADKQFVREAIRTKFLSADKLLGPKIRGKRSHQLIGI